MENSKEEVEEREGEEEEPKAQAAECRSREMRKEDELEGGIGKMTKREGGVVRTWRKRRGRERGG